MSNEEENVVQLPDDGIINTQWALEQMERASLFSSFGLNANKGRIFFMLKTNMSMPAYEKSVQELEYTVETAEVYLSFLEKLPTLEAIRKKYFTSLSLSAASIIPDDITDAYALMDICLSRVGKPTAKNLTKAAELSGKTVKIATTSALTVEKLKRKALTEWLLSEHQLSEDDILQASRQKPEGLKEFTEKMSNAYFLLEDWKIFYDIIAAPVNDSDNAKALRFLADLQDASGSINEFLVAEANYNNLAALKETFELEIYPKLSFEASK